MRLIATTYLIIIGIIAFAGDGDAPNKQKVYSIVKQFKTNEWYATQEKLWEQEVKTNPNNADAWLNLYTASRMLRIMGGGRTLEDQQQILERAEKAIPNSFEYHYMYSWNSNHEPEAFEHLKKAYEIDPDRPETYDDFVTFYELNRNHQQLKSFCEKWFESNDMSSNLYAWAYNLLHSVEEDNAILITHGDNDTYPLWVLQQAKEIRKNVVVLNGSLLWEETYRNKRFKELGIPEMTKKNKDFVSGEDGYASIMEHLFKHSGRPLYFSTTVDSKHYKKHEDQMYLVGLAYKWCKNDFDNIAVLKKNYEKRFMLDYLKLSTQYDISESVINRMNTTYLGAFITLHNHYQEAEQLDRMTEIEDLIYKIAESADQTQQVERIMKPGKSSGYSEVLQKSKDALRGMLKVNAKLYVGQTEVSNEQYQLFLTDLMKLGRHEDLKKAAPNQVNWTSLIPNELSGIHDAKLFQHGHPNDDRLPVCNISYEAAQMYCTWLTDFYNNVDDKKKSYKKVKFYLPTEEQWQNLAIGGKYEGQSRYPWSSLESNKADAFDRDTIVNLKGCFLANINTGTKLGKEDNMVVCENHDGGVFTVPVSSYLPNSYGLYCTIGNVAEMVQEKGIAKGGGWNTPIEEAIISSRQTYQGSSPNVGFRVIMEVIEE